MLCEPCQSLTLDAAGSKTGYLVHHSWLDLSNCLSCELCKCFHERLSTELCRSYLTQLDYDSKLSHSAHYPEERKRRKAKSPSIRLAHGWFQDLETPIKLYISNMGKESRKSIHSDIMNMGISCGLSGFCFDYEDENGSIYLRKGLANEWQWTHQHAQIPIWVDEGDSLAELGFSQRRPLVSNPMADSVISTVKQWIETCSTHHPDCRRPSIPERALPRRLLDLSQAVDKKVRIVEIASSFSDEYVTLSYCWGPVSNTPWLAQWLSYIIEVQQSGGCAMNTNRMPQTIQDAITVCLALGFQWLWVDCLCILQGQYSDWGTESGRMSEIYEGSVLTLSASETPDCRDGFLTPRSDIQLQGVMLNLQAESGESGVLHLGTHSNKFADLVRHGPVAARAWCLQERVLATRVLHYCTSQVFFECARCRRHESEQKPTLELDKPSDYSKIPRMEFELEELAKPSSYSATILQWYFTVEDYTARNLTMTSDKLVALSGLAKKFSQSFQCEYMAGLWTKFIHVGLAWEASDDACSVRVPARAPSWSWAVMDGPVVWKKSLDMGGTIATDDGLLEPAISLVDAASEKATTDPFGPVGDTWLVVTGRLQTIPGQNLLVNSTLTHPQWLSGRTDKIGYVFEDEDRPLGGDLLCLLIAKKPWGIGPSLPPVNIVLVLEEDAKHGASTYRRLGCGQVFPPDFFDNTPISTMRLV